MERLKRIDLDTYIIKVDLDFSSHIRLELQS